MIKELEDIQTVGDLVHYLRGETAVEYLFFPTQTMEAPGEIDEKCLSNEFPAGFTLDDVQYPTAEHFVMAERARFFEDPASLQNILAAPTADEAKALGDKVAGFNDFTWMKKRFPVVLKGNLAKFSQNPDLKRFLLETGSRVLVGTTPEDRIWGIGLSKGDPAAGDPTKWRGLNLLGFALMQVREKLKGG